MHISIPCICWGKKAWDFFAHFEVIINERIGQNMDVLMDNDTKHRNAFYVIDQMIDDNVNPKSIVKRILGLGNLKTVLSIADEYIPDNIDIMVIHSATGSYTYTSSGNAKFGEIPLKVLIDSSTSGYGVLLAGLLTIYENAELIGSPTSKDGKLHTIYKVHDNPSYYVRIPIHDYFIADDIVLNGVGLIPKKSTPEKQELTVNN
jgi:hypothetical protein